MKSWLCRRPYLRAISVVAALLATGCTAAGPSGRPGTPRADLLLRGGTIYPGGAKPFSGDVAITDDRIIAVGPSLQIAAKQTIDATGMIVAPGFIDPHTHMQPWLTSDEAHTRVLEPFLLQGVTTAFIGNDGGGPINVGPLLDSASARPVGINYAVFTGFGTIRSEVIGNARRAPTASELAMEQALVRKAMCEGAIGFSTGLFYAPQSFSRTDEVIALAAVAGAMGGIYDTHLRDESNYNIGLSAAVDEVIRIAREGGIAAHISHIKALGADVQGTAPQIVGKIEAARAEGLAITASQYPWSASGTSLVASLVPLWAQDGGRTAMLERFDDVQQAQRLRAGIADNLRRRGGADSLLIVEGDWAGKRLNGVAAELRTDPVTAASAIIRQADPAVISFNMDEADIATFMRQLWVMTGSDASPNHPRAYGSFARKYAIYSLQEQIVSLQQFIDSSSATTADFFHLEGRGHLRPGAFADVLIFDPRAYSALATYEHPDVAATGVRTVIVNGQIAVDHGKVTGVASGRALRRQPPAGNCN